MGNSSSFSLEKPQELSSTSRDSIKFTHVKCFTNIETLHDISTEFLKNTLVIAYGNNHVDNIALVHAKTLRFMRIKELSRQNRYFFCEISRSLNAVLCFQSKTIWICTSSNLRNLNFVSLQEDAKIKTLVVPKDENEHFLSVIDNKINTWTLLNGRAQKLQSPLEIEQCQYIHSLCPLQSNNLVLANVLSEDYNSSSYIVIDWRNRQFLREIKCARLSLLQNIVINSRADKILAIALEACQLSVNLLSTIRFLKCEDQGKTQLCFEDKNLSLETVNKSPLVVIDSQLRTLFLLNDNENEAWYTDLNDFESINELPNLKFNVQGVTACKILPSSIFAPNRYLVTCNLSKKRLDFFNSKNSFSTCF